MVEFYETNEIPLLTSKNTKNLQRLCSDLEFYIVIDNLPSEMSKTKIRLGIITDIPIKNEIKIKTQIQNKTMILYFHRILNYKLNKCMLPSIRDIDTRVGSINIICCYPIETIDLTQRAKNWGLEQRYRMTDIIYEK